MANSSKLITISATAGNAVSKTQITEDGGLILRFAHIKLTTDGTVASRYTKLSLLDADGSTVIADWHAGVAQVASATDQHHEFMPGIYRETAFINGTLQVPFPTELHVQKGQYLQFSIDGGAAGDSFSGYAQLSN